MVGARCGRGPIFWLGSHPTVSIAGLLLLGLGIANVYPVVAPIAVGLLPGEAEVAILRLIFTGSSAILAAPFALGIFGDVLGIGNAFGVLVPISVAAIAIAVGMQRANAQSPAPPAEPQLVDRNQLIYS
jgi:MFS family permease